MGSDNNALNYFKKKNGRKLQNKKKDSKNSFECSLRVKIKKINIELTESINTIKVIIRIFISNLFFSILVILSILVNLI
jgi:hypothetical protein